MKKICLIIFVLSVFTFNAIPQQKFPEAEISNGSIKARLYLPDSKEGYYRATRFDWSGVIPMLEYKGHNFYGQWFERYNPTTHDAVMGPVEEFAPVGFNDIKAGASFIKIGVGALLKPDETAYSSFKLYKIANPGKWTTRKKSDEIQFIHELKDSEYSYEYEKSVQLIKGKHEMVISHTLKNTGKRTIETNVYDHNFPVIDKQPVGPGYVIKFAVNIAGSGQGIGDIVQIKDKQMTFLKEVTKSDKVYCGSVEGFSSNVKDYDIRIENNIAGAGIRITCDQPILKLVFWSCSTTACPEPYIQIKVEPGKKFTWKISYEYYTL